MDLTLQDDGKLKGTITPITPWVVKPIKNEWP